MRYEKKVNLMQFYSVYINLYLDWIGGAWFTWAFHAHVLMIIFRRKFWTVQGCWPGESEALKNWITPCSNLFAKSSTRSYWQWYLFGAHWCVHRAQKQVQLGTADSTQFYILLNHQHIITSKSQLNLQICKFAIIKNFFW